MTPLRAKLLLLLLPSLGAAACTSPREAMPQTVPQKARQAVQVSLECELSAPSRVRPGEPVPVHFRLTNRTAQTVYVLTWRTPLEGLLGNDFRITRDGQELPYQGPLVKRGEPEAEDYVAIAPGASAEADVDVSLAYALGPPGRYRLAFRGPVMDAATDAAQVPRPLAELRAVPVQCPEAETERASP